MGGNKKSILKIEKFKYAKTTKINIYKSQLIKGIKKKNLKLILKQLTNISLIKLSNFKKLIE